MYSGGRAEVRQVAGRVSCGPLSSVGVRDRSVRGQRGDAACRQGQRRWGLAFLRPPLPDPGRPGGGSGKAVA
jgi:hypothetical protein